MEANLKQKTIYGFFWRLIQNAGTQVVSFVVAMVLARILEPSDYGLVAMIAIFTEIASIFVNAGVTSALIQREKLKSCDIDTMFWSGVALGVVLYLFLFIISPWVADFYNEPQLNWLLRVQSITILLGAFFSVPQALFVRNLLFKKTFKISFAAAVISGFVGIMMASQNFGAWSLVCSGLAGTFITLLLSWLLSSYRPQLKFSKSSFLQMFSFSLNILLSQLGNSLFNNIRALVVGKKYSGTDLAFFNKGCNLPTLAMCQIDGAMNTVLFSSLSKIQSDWEYGLRVMRRSIRTSLFVCTPIMFGMAAVAEPLITVIFTEKWLPCVPYLQLMAVLCSFWPLSGKMRALEALGHSRTSFQLTITSNIVCFLILLYTYRISPWAMLFGTLVWSIAGFFLFSPIYRKYLNYHIGEQIRDAFPVFFIASIMAVAVHHIDIYNSFPLASLIIKIIMGGGIYILLAVVFRFEQLAYLKNIIAEIISKRRYSDDI